MDPISIIGTTSAVVCFIDFIWKASRYSRPLFGLKEQMQQNQRFDDLAAALKPALQALTAKVEVKGKDVLSDEESSLLKVIQQCVVVEEKIRELMGSLRDNAGVSDNPFAKAWSKATGSLQMLWAKQEAADLREEFNTCTTQLNLHLALISRTEIIQKLDDLASTHTQHFKDIPEILKAVRAIEVAISGRCLNLSAQSDNSIESETLVGSTLESVPSTSSYEGKKPDIDTITEPEPLLEVSKRDWRFRTQSIGEVLAYGLGSADLRSLNGEIERLTSNGPSSIFERSPNYFPEQYTTKSRIPKFLAAR